MAISVELIKKLRELTGCSVADCKKALEESGGDLEKAIKSLQKKGLEIAKKKSDRVVSQGRIESYVHLGDKLGVLLEVNCESDFVARNEDFKRFTKDVAMQIAAANPTYLSQEDVPKEEIDKSIDREVFVKEHCLLEQPFIKDPNLTIKDYLHSMIAKIGENIVIRRFTRYQVGE
ncbi:MAG: translation elongation factor Ts [Candidatus Omnitrophota bacterium]|nr:translation elongation factor Ts [Candidatus Omnitrophota bacterium]